MSKTYKHQLKFNSHKYWENYRWEWGWKWHYHQEKGGWEPPFYAGWMERHRTVKFWQTVMWRKLRHQWKRFLKNPDRPEPNRKPEDIAWIVD